MRSWILISTLVCAACAPTFSKKPPLAFSELPYTSPEGKPWPEARVAVPETAAAYGLATIPEVAVIELGPADGTPIVFIHGLGSYLKFWRYQLDVFAARGYRVLALDLPGYGKSDKPATFPYSMTAMADVVREVVASRGITRPILVGHSMGGQTALSYAIRYPDEPRALVLTSPAGFEKFTRKEREWFQRAFSSSLVKSTSETGIWGSVRYSNFYRWRPELEWLIEERVRLAKAPEFDAYAYAQVKSVQGLTQTDFIRERLDKVKAPTLIIYGEVDRLIPSPFFHGGFTREIMDYGHRGISGSELVELQRCGHSVQLDCPEEYNGKVLGFIEGHRQ